MSNTLSVVGGFMNPSLNDVHEGPPIKIGTHMVEQGLRPPLLATFARRLLFNFRRSSDRTGARCGR